MGTPTAVMPNFKKMQTGSKFKQNQNSINPKGVNCKSRLLWGEGQLVAESLEKQDFYPDGNF